MSEHSVALFEHLVFLFGGRNHHAFVGAVDFEEDRHFEALLVLESLFVDQSLILRITILIVDKQVAHGTREAQRYFLAALFRLKFEAEVLWEAFWEACPDTISVQLKW